MNKQTVIQTMITYNNTIGKENDTYCYWDSLEKIGSKWYVDFRLSGMTFDDRVTRKLGNTLTKANDRIKSW